MVAGNKFSVRPRHCSAALLLLSEQKESKEDKGDGKGSEEGVEDTALPSRLWRALVSLRHDQTNQPDGWEKQREAEELTQTRCSLCQSVKTTPTGAQKYGHAAQMADTETQN